MEYALKFWLAYLQNGIPREVPDLRHLEKTIISYSDGEGSGGIGVAIFGAHLPRPKAGFMKTPEVLREVWIQIESRLRMSSSYEDIFQLEAIGPLIALCTWPELLSGCL